MPKERAEDRPAVAGDVLALLQACGIDTQDEVALRRALEERVPGYSLYRLTPAAVHE